MLFCPKCGKQYHDTTKFCHNDGVELIAHQPQPNPPIITPSYSVPHGNYQTNRLHEAPPLPPPPQEPSILSLFNDLVKTILKKISDWLNSPPPINNTIQTPAQQISYKTPSLPEFLDFKIVGTVGKIIGRAIQGISVIFWLAISWALLAYAVSPPQRNMWGGYSQDDGKVIICILGLFAETLISAFLFYFGCVIVASEQILDMLYGIFKNTRELNETMKQ